VSRRFGYGPRPQHGDHFPHGHGFPPGGSYTHFEPRHLDGSHFPRRGSRSTSSNGEVQKTVKTSSGRMVKCWIPNIYLTIPNTEPLTSYHLEYVMDEGLENSWLMDSGCSQHMTKKQEMVLQPHSPITQGVCDFWG
jgi:hypothetical protein